MAEGVITLLYILVMLIFSYLLFTDERHSLMISYTDDDGETNVDDGRIISKAIRCCGLFSKTHSNSLFNLFF